MRGAEPNQRLEKSDRVRPPSETWMIACRGRNEQSVRCFLVLATGKPNFLMLFDISWRETDFLLLLLLSVDKLQVSGLWCHKSRPVPNPTLSI